MGLIKKAKRKPSKVMSVANVIKGICHAHCDVAIAGDGKSMFMCIEGVTAPSLNVILRYHAHYDFHPINTAWRTLILNAGLLCRPRRMSIASDERVHIHIHCIRKVLVDHDNICVKSIVDAVAKDSFIPDDNPSVVSSVTTSQEKGPINMLMLEAIVHSCTKHVWRPSSDVACTVLHSSTYISN